MNSKGGMRRRGHAVVIGGSMAGLLAGRVLSDHFDEVTVVERDRLSEIPAPRKGVPQARHLHVLLNRGLRILNSLFPRLQDELIARGAPLLDMAKDLSWLTPAGWGVNFDSDIAILGCSRDLLEWCTRQQLAAVKGVHFRDGCQVRGLVPSADGAAVRGVRLQLDDQAAPDEQLEADLIVDASGRGSRAPQWLESMGFEGPEEIVINASLGYTSRVFQRRGKLPDGYSGAYIQPAPPNDNRGGVLFPVEGDRWIMTLAGYGGDYPPTNEAGFLDFARSLRSSVLFDAVKDAEPLSEIYSYRATENRLRRYEKLSRLPEGLLVGGDAACAFNPVYAQGMTAAALSAVTMGECLADHRRRHSDGSLSGISIRFQKRLAQVNTAPWMLATSEDYRVRGVIGGTPDRMTRFMQGYVNRVVACSTESAAVRDQLLKVFNLVEAPTALFHPRVVMPVAGKLLRRRRAESFSLREKVARSAG